MSTATVRRQEQRGTSAALHDKGLALHRAGQLEAARAIYRQILDAAPRHADTLHMLGVLAFQQNDFGNAVDLISQASQLLPASALVHFNLGNALRAVRRLEDAGQAYLQALQLRPDHLEALTNLGNICKEQNRLDEALACYDRILALQPAHALTRYNKSIALLMRGDLAQGWDLYESRTACATTDVNHRGPTIPRQARDWDGKPLSKPLLVLPEQGLGDQVFYGSMLSDLEATGIESFVCLDERLLPLFRRSFPGLDFASPTQIAGLDPAQHLFGAQTLVGSLGRFYRRNATDLASIRSHYLFADAQATSALRSRIANGNKLICGLSWSSQVAGHGASKSLPLQDLLPVLQVPNVEFIDLQYGDTLDERVKLETGTGVRLRKLDDIDNKNDIDGLAALISACDLIITISNTTAHLAAALGKPVLILLAHHTPLWYWHADDMTSPWYPTVTLLRQSRPGDWQQPVMTAAQVLAGLTT